MDDLHTAAFRGNPSGMVVTSLEDGRLVDFNDAFTQLTGYEREEAIGRTTTELGLWVQPEKRAEMLADLRLRGRASTARSCSARRAGTSWKPDARPA
jgi:PAS domain S-box-containing protein